MHGKRHAMAGDEMGRQHRRPLPGRTRAAVQVSINSSSHRRAVILRAPCGPRSLLRLPRRKRKPLDDRTAAATQKRSHRGSPLAAPLRRTERGVGNGIHKR